jgi:hypothetical protein
MTGTPDAVTDQDVNEFVRTYARPNAWRGTEGLCQAVFADNGATKAPRFSSSPDESTPSASTLRPPHDRFLTAGQLDVTERR